MRWVWSYDKYTERESGMGKAIKWGVCQVIRFLKLWDLQASSQPDHFIANSRAVAERIKACYGRIAEVIYPPINVNRFALSSHQGDYYLVLSRLIAYKRLDLAVRACTLLGRKLVVAGSGPALDELRKIAGPTITFAGRVSDEEAVKLAGECRALIFPGEEDFGMTPLEVAAAGRPTIAFAAGGALETIVDGRTGVFFEHPTPESLAEAIERFEQQSWSQVALRAHAEQFSIAVFQRRMQQFLEKVGVPQASARVMPHALKAEPRLLRSA
jgi:glycosyltransferase involved in cell wall biosynthesis